MFPPYKYYNISRDYTKYQDFDYRSENYVFEEEFNWFENGTYVLEKYANDYIEYINNEFSCINEFCKLITITWKCY